MKVAKPSVPKLGNTGMRPFERVGVTGESTSNSSAKSSQHRDQSVGNTSFSLTQALSSSLTLTLLVMISQSKKFL